MKQTVALEKANQILGFMVVEGRPPKIAPLVLLSIASLVINAIRMWQGCRKTPEQAHAEMQNLTSAHRRKMKNMIKEKLKDNDDLSRKEVREAIHDTMVKLAKCTMLAEVEALYKEASDTK